MSPNWFICEVFSYMMLNVADQTNMNYINLTKYSIPNKKMESLAKQGGIMQEVVFFCAQYIIQYNVYFSNYFHWPDNYLHFAGNCHFAPAKRQRDWRRIWGRRSFLLHQARDGKNIIYLNNNSWYTFCRINNSNVALQVNLHVK